MTHPLTLLISHTNILEPHPLDRFHGQSIPLVKEWLDHKHLCLSKTPMGPCTHTRPQWYMGYDTMLQESSLSFEVPKISAARENNETIIFATLVLPMNLTRVNQVCQIGPVNGDDDSLGMHALSGDNIN